MNSTNDFADLFDKMLNAQTEAEEITAALALADHYQTLLETHALAQDFSNKEETFLEGGVALASQYALDCLRDPLRTTRFIVGTYQAIKDQLTQNNSVNLLYAGCGPAAPLVLPLLHRFASKEIRVSLLDITESSIKAVKSLVHALDLQGYIVEYITADAITYKAPQEHFDIMVSETMDKGLTREPQVRIMQNLIPQLKENGLFIPQAIDVYGELTFYGKEPYFDLYKDLQSLGPCYKTALKKKLFSIAQDVTNDQPYEFTSDAIEIPSDLSQTPDAAVYAEIQVYKERILPKAKSLISNSYCIRSLLGGENKHFKYHYTTQGTPSWELRIE
ncbi:methyltransferase domain-containing protein [Gilvibacter sediminis]|uniref:methyltransferase domain-containing protein n=1 Tax=Gilvibacter sediminis TaxID=379071 RepID=UPI00234FC7B3|nr:methyltransferase domain-containing protein [Gilvibacter sediminis]MDC7998579.1 methyltransferase domain-containing protein [Gilvibacter sediminis]